MPVPAPATLELLGAPIYSGEIQKELVTPTGAAIVKVLVKSFGPRPPMKTDKTGYGAGSRNFDDHPERVAPQRGRDGRRQLVRVERSLVGAEEEIAILEANLDDLNPQLIGYITEVAFSQGALDVFTAAGADEEEPPGNAADRAGQAAGRTKLREMIFRESSTLGIRVRREKRYALPRRHESGGNAVGRSANEDRRHERQGLAVCA